ncbi:MAG: DHHA1 domain-containing protein, partial [Candidatus Lokiarchaeota archaeon]
MDKKPNRSQFLENLEIAANAFIDLSSNLREVCVISHNDADGISCLHLILSLLHKMNINYDYFIYNRSTSWDNYLNGILSKSPSKKNAYILTDVGSNLEELVPIIKKRKEYFFILDHHEVELGKESFEDLDNLYFVNPTLFGFDGLEHVAGATLTYLFTKKINPLMTKNGWLTIIGIAGDSLKSMDKLQSFNKEIYEELVMEEVVEDKVGLILFGAMYDSIKNALKYSILPFVPGLGGESDKQIKNFLSNLSLDPDKKLINLDEEEIHKIERNIDINNLGHYALMPQKQGMLKFAFEHALLLNILCFKNISAALSIIQHRQVTRYAKSLYRDYIDNLTKNLRVISKELPRFETEKAIFINVKNRIPPSNWSDTASFSTVNEILDPYKMLFLGGEEKKSQTIKLSIRCTRKYLEQNNGIGVNKIISKIKENLGGMGGGHKLAGGIRLSKPSYKRLKK